MLTRSQELALHLEANPADDLARAEWIGVLLDRGQVQLARRIAEQAPSPLQADLLERIHQAGDRASIGQLVLPRRRAPFLLSCLSLFALALLTISPALLLLVWPKIEHELRVWSELELLETGSRAEQLAALSWLDARAPERAEGHLVLAAVTWEGLDTPLALELLRTTSGLEDYTLPAADRIATLVLGLERAELEVRQRALSYLRSERNQSWEVYSRLERAYAEDEALRVLLFDHLRRPPKEPPALRAEALSRTESRVRAALESQDKALAKEARDHVDLIQVEQVERAKWEAFVRKALRQKGSVRARKALLELGLRMAMPEAGELILAEVKRGPRWGRWSGKQLDRFGKRLVQFKVPQLQAWYDAKPSASVKSALARELGRRGVVVLDPVKQKAANRKKKPKTRGRR